MGRILAIDVASASGWAHDGYQPGVPIAGRFNAPRIKDKEYGPLFLAFAEWIENKIMQAAPEIISFEAPLQMVGAGSIARKYTTNQGTIRILFGLVAIAECAAARHQIRCYEANVATIKKYFTGDGRAQKIQMKAQCRQLGWPGSDDDNIADACAQWALAKSLDDPRWAPLSSPIFNRPQVRP